MIGELKENYQDRITELQQKITSQQQEDSTTARTN
jgi:hypothetical protein